MGLPGLAVALCFAIASTSFVVALQFTTVANILLMQAGVPLIAALVCRILFGEQLRVTTWLAIAVVISGVAVMVSDSLTGRVSPVGDGLRSEEHTSELQSLMRISYAVFCLKKK